MYKSPIEILTSNAYNTISKNVDDAIMQAILDVSIKVDKEELIRALQYDRAQYKVGYNAGYEDGYAAARRVPVDGVALWL